MFERHRELLKYEEMCDDHLEDLEKALKHKDFEKAAYHMNRLYYLQKSAKEEINFKYGTIKVKYSDRCEYRSNRSYHNRTAAERLEIINEKVQEAENALEKSDFFKS